MSNSTRSVFVGLILLVLGTHVYAQANDVDCVRCVDPSDIAAEAVNSNKIEKHAVTTEKLAKQAVTSGKIAPGAVGNGKIKNGAVTENKLSASLSNTIAANAMAIQELDLAMLDAEIQMATDYGRAGMHNGNSALVVLKSLIATLGLTCAEANYGLFLACTQIMAGDGTVWPISQLLPAQSLALVIVDDFEPIAGMPTPLLFVAQTNSQPGDMVVAGTANLLRWTYRDQDDTDRLVDDCENPTIAMSPASHPNNVTSSRWRVNNGGYFYVPYDPNTGRQVPTGQIDVTGQTVGVVKNIHPFGVIDASSIVWCEMSNQVTGIYNMFDVLPFPFNLNEARFSMPMTPN